MRVEADAALGERGRERVDVLLHVDEADVRVEEAVPARLRAARWGQAVRCILSGPVNDRRPS